MDDISRRYIGGGWLFSMGNNWQVNPLNTITIDHITAFPDYEGGILALGNKMSNPQMYGFVFTNSIVTAGRYPVWNASGGATSCAHSDVPLTSLGKCFASYTFNNNALVAAPAHYPPSLWPTGNLFANDTNTVDFAQYNNSNGGNYQLMPGSPYKNMGTDGRDLGADIAGLNAALAGVE